jgi:hypothetical protein
VKVAKTVPMENRETLHNQVLETANRLRLIQVDFSDESEQTRNAYLCEEIERTLKTVLPEQRNDFLERLMARFPKGRIDSAAPLQQQKPVSAAAVDLEKLKDINFLVQHFLELIPALSPQQKEFAVRSLREAGLELPGSDRPSHELVQDLKAKLQLSDEPSLEADQLVELVVLMADFVFKLEPLMWKTWRILSPRSSIRPSNGLRKTAGKFVCDGSDAARKQFENELKGLQRLIAAMVTAVGRVGHQFAKRHLTKFAPSEITALVRMEHGSVFVSHEVRCWRKYLELADTLTEDLIETEIRKAVADYAESLVRGSER